MKDSAERLEMFMQEEYIDNPHMGAPDMSTAIRDLLTDLLHIGVKYDVNIPHRLIDAEEVFEEEKEE
jgi:hypothetical protein